MRSRIFFKLMFVFLLVIGVTAITLQLTVHKVWERTLREQIERNLKQKTLMFAYRVEADRQHSLADITAQEGQAAGARATVIDPTGKVLADSETDPGRWRITRIARSLFPLSPAKSVSMNVRVKLSRFRLCTRRRRSQEERCVWRIRCPRSKSPIVRWARLCSGDRSVHLFLR